jgi:DNA-binding CsgD family transcriptional regulator
MELGPWLDHEPWRKGVIDVEEWAEIRGRHRAERLTIKAIVRRESDGRGMIKYMAGRAPSVLYGREDERARIASLVALATRGLGGALVLRGDAGIGKSALLDDAVATATGVRVSRLTGVRAELDLPYAALQHLLSKHVSAIDGLPQPQANALRGALGLGGDRSPDRYLVALATLTLLADAAEETSVLAVIDDAQWVDRETVNALAFVSRRLVAEAVAVLWAVRDDPDLSYDDPLGGIPSLTIGGLSDVAAAAMVTSVVDGPVDPRVRRRIVNDAHGSPLAVVDLCSELNADQLAGRSALPESLPVSRSRERFFNAQVGALPPATQLMLLTAAADSTGDTALVARAGVTLGFDLSSSAAAEAIDLIRLGDRITFRHPLAREAVYQRAPLVQRQHVHAALAAATDERADPDRCAWHRAVAATGQDEALARELESAAARAHERGGYAARTTLLHRAAELTPDRGTRAARYLVAGTAAFEAGALPAARADVARALPDLGDAMLLAQAHRVLGTLAVFSAEPLERGSNDAAATLVDAAAAMAVFDRHSARETFFDALVAARWYGTWSTMDVRAVARAARSHMGPRDDEHDAGDLLHDAIVALYSDGYAAAVPLLRRALDEPFDASVDSQAVWRTLSMRCWASFALGDFARLHRVVTDLIDRARASGALVHLAPAYNYRSKYELAVGSIAAADSDRVLQSEVVEALNLHASIDVEPIILAWLGRERELRALAALVEHASMEIGIGTTLDQLHWAVMLLELGIGDYVAAAAAVPTGPWTNEFSTAPYIASDAVEALSRTKRHDEARALVEWLDERATATKSRADLGLFFRARALLGESGDAVESDFVDALTAQRDFAADHHIARTQLVYGEWLRRQRRRADAIEQLDSAMSIFAAIGARAFAERTQRELIAAGSHRRRSVDDTRYRLTVQERSVAEMAATGATNGEIAAGLFISPHTVAYHLAKVLRKLNLSSRRQLATAFSDPVRTESQ